MTKATALTHIGTCQPPTITTHLKTQQDFAGGLSVVFPGIERLNLSPVYIRQNIFVCLDCGFAELVIPGPELDQLRNGIAGSSRSQTA
jgi:hypothetical protein